MPGIDVQRSSSNLGSIFLSRFLTLLYLQLFILFWCFLPNPVIKLRRDNPCEDLTMWHLMHSANHLLHAPQNHLFPKWPDYLHSSFHPCFPKVPLSCTFSRPVPPPLFINYLTRFWQPLSSLLQKRERGGNNTVTVYLKGSIQICVVTSGGKWDFETNLSSQLGNRWGAPKARLGSPEEQPIPFQNCWPTYLVIL